MSNTNGVTILESRLQNLVLYYRSVGVLYHHGIIELVKRDLRGQGVAEWDSWGIFIGAAYEYNEEKFVAEVLKANGRWNSSESGNIYDRYSDEEITCHELWNSGQRDLNAIAAGILFKYPTTEWFGISIPADKVQQFLHESGKIGY